MDISFYPGPSKIFPKVKEHLTDAYASGILQENHRSEAFMDLLEKTIKLFKQKLNIPEEFEVFFTSSATECWEIVNQSLLHGNVQFLYNGAFGKKWFKYAVTNQNIVPCELRGSRFLNEQLATDIELNPRNNCVCLTQNETSNGTYISNEQLEQIKTICPEAYLFIDVTSSMGGQDLKWSLGDVWLASVQKCFGLPSGMGIMVVSNKAIKKAYELADRNHYNSLISIFENFQKFQTHYTPNTLSIYLLNKTLSDIDSYPILFKEIEKREGEFIDFIKKNTDFKLLVSNQKCRSKTVIALLADEIQLKTVKEKAKTAGIKLGNGYGEWRNSTFRIANFPALDNEDFTALKSILQK